MTDRKHTNNTAYSLSLDGMNDDATDGAADSGNDIEEGIISSPTSAVDEESNGTIDSNDSDPAYSSFLAIFKNSAASICSGVAPGTPSSLTSLNGRDQIHDGAGKSSFAATEDAGGLPTEASDDETREFKVEEKPVAAVIAAAETGVGGQANRDVARRSSFASTSGDGGSLTEASTASRGNYDARYMTIDDINNLTKELSKNQDGLVNVRDLGKIMTKKAAVLENPVGSAAKADTGVDLTMVGPPSTQRRNQGQLKSPFEESQNQGHHFGAVEATISGSPLAESSPHDHGRLKSPPPFVNVSGSPFAEASPSFVAASNPRSNMTKSSSGLFQDPPDYPSETKRMGSISGLSTKAQKTRRVVKDNPNIEGSSLASKTPKGRDFKLDQIGKTAKVPSTGRESRSGNLTMESSANQNCQMDLGDLADASTERRVPDRTLPLAGPSPDLQRNGSQGQLKSPFPCNVDNAVRDDSNSYSDASNAIEEAGQFSFVYDADSLGSYQYDAAAGNHLNSPFVSPLFAEDPVIQNTLSRSVHGLTNNDTATLPPGGVQGSIANSTAEVNRMWGVVEQSNIRDDAPPTQSAIEREVGGNSVTRKIRGEFPEHVRDDGGPDPFAPAAAFEDTDFARKVRAQAASEARDDTRQVTSTQPNELSLPVPFNYSMFEDPKIQKRPSQGDGESISFPRLDEEESGAELLSETRTPAGIKHRLILDHRGTPLMNPMSNIRELFQPQTSNTGVIAANPDAANSVVDLPLGDGDEVSNTPSASGIDEDGSVVVIPEAYLVERQNSEIIIATQLDPPVPFYKQKRIVCFLSIVMLTIIGIAVGVTSSLNGTPETVELIAPLIPPPPSSSPSNSIAPTTVRSSSPSDNPSHSPSVTPTTVRSSSPSTSFTPSSSPSSCLDTISNGRQTLDLPLGSPSRPKVAIDGRNMVVVAKDTNLDYVYVVFYSLEDGGDWVQKTKYFIEEYRYDGESIYGESVALSGSTALVGLGRANTDAGENAGLVYIYKQDSEGVWNKAQESIIPEGGKSEGDFFGFMVDIDADFACVIAYSGVYIFRRDGSQQWDQIQRFGMREAERCSVVGSAIAIQLYNKIKAYQFDQDLGEYVPLQDKLYGDAHSMSLSKNHLIYSTLNEVFIYHRQYTYQPFSLHQRFISSFSNDNFWNALALDNDILVIGEDKETHVYSDQNGVFEKSLSLNQGYKLVQISGRSLIAVTYEAEVHAFAIDDCTQAMPTQTPSASSSPTKLSSSSPSTSESPSQSPSESSFPIARPSSSARPSTSSSPTETCYSIDVSVLFDRSPHETSWDVQRINDVGDNIVVKTYQGTWDDKYMLRKESMCLEEGQYQFTIYDLRGDGLVFVATAYDDDDYNNVLLFRSPGHYNVASYGGLIVEGAMFEYNETTSFFLPYARVPSAMPSISFAPSMSSRPSTHPSESFAPSMSPSSSPSARPSESSAPSMSPSLSVRPSASSSPTETCYRIDVSVRLDWFPQETSWDVQRINDVGDNIVVKTYQGTYDDDQLTMRKESMCLEEGQYQFTIYDSWGNGLYVYDDDEVNSLCGGHYNVTSYGELIVEGQRFEYNETTSFFLPHVRVPSAMPSISFAPSMSSLPSARPSESFAPSTLPSSSARPSTSFSPTETCYWIDVSVRFDQYPHGTSWDVQRINDFGDNIVVKTYQGTYDDHLMLRQESMCLEEGQYQFTIYDSRGNGLYVYDDDEINSLYGGHYNVTSYGGLIVKGAEFIYSETTSFSLPLPSAPSTTP